MRKRVYHRFPMNKVEFQQNYRLNAGMPYLLKIFANMNGKSGSFEVKNEKGMTISAKRAIAVDITEASVDFIPLTVNKLAEVLESIEPSGVVDIRVRLQYSYLDDQYKRVPFQGDVFLVRVGLSGDVLNLKVDRMEGPGFTASSEIADTIVDEIGRGDPE